MNRLNLAYAQWNLVSGWTRFILALGQVLLLSACMTASGSRASSAPARLEGFEQELDQTCGQHIVYPINARCIRFMGSVGPLLQHRSDLVMKIWRSCPEESPCYRIVSKEPACAADSSHPWMPDSANKTCLKAERANYSCAALLNDPVYTQAADRKPVESNFECQQAKAALARFDREINQMAVRIQWYRSFAAQGF